MKPGELRECLRRLNMTEAQLAKMLGKRSLSQIDEMTARCIRAVVLKPHILELYKQWRIVFPEATLIAIRTVEHDTGR